MANLGAKNQTLITGQIAYGYDGSDAYPIYVDSGGKARVTNQNYLQAIAEGDIPNHEPYFKLGYNGDVGATEEDIWTNGGTYVFPDVPKRMRVVSSHADDDAAGAGVRTVRISYLDSTYAATTETITMAGTAAVLTTAVDILRVNAIRVLTTGTALVAAGTINIANTAGTVVYRTIDAGYTRGRSAIYTVPLGKVLFITQLHVASGYTTSGKVVRWTFRSNYDDVGDTVLPVGLMVPHFEAMTQDSLDTRVLDVPIKVPATVDWKVSAVSNGATSFCQCSARGWIEDA